MCKGVKLQKNNIDIKFFTHILTRHGGADVTWIFYDKVTKELNSVYIKAGEIGDTRKFEGYQNVLKRFFEKENISYVNDKPIKQSYDDYDDIFSNEKRAGKDY